MPFIGDGELAVSQCVPQLDRSVAGPGDDLSIVGGEGNREDVVGMPNKPTGRHTRR